jgi:hypothetical protein
LLKANTDAARLKLIELFGTHYIQKLSIGGAFVISADASSNSAKNDLLDYVYYLVLTTLILSILFNFLFLLSSFSYIIISTRLLFLVRAWRPRNAKKVPNKLREP